MKERLRYVIVGRLMRLESFIKSLIEKLDVCHVCKEPADYWCESCERRHCGEHESRAYGDVECCTMCAPTAEELKAEYDAMTEEEKAELIEEYR